MLNENEKFENYLFNFSIFQPVLAVNAYVRTSHSMVVLERPTKVFNFPPLQNNNRKIQNVLETPSVETFARSLKIHETKL